jgi:hypothetical protein
MNANHLLMAVLMMGVGVFPAMRTDAMHTESMGPIAYWEGISGEVGYVSGGVGLDERDAMRGIEGNYNTKLMCALKSGEYVSDVKVDILDAMGGKVLEETTKGPWFFVDLPEGSYRLAVSYEGRTEERDIKAGDDLRGRFCYW